MTLTANREVNRYVDQDLREHPVEANVHIYKGALCSFSASGHVQPLVAVDNDFAGIAYEEADNTGGADGDKKCRVFTVGDFELALGSATQADVGMPVYASADDTLTMTSTSNTYVGVISGFVSAGVVIVRLDYGRAAA